MTFLREEYIIFHIERKSIIDYAGNFMLILNPELTICLDVISILGGSGHDIYVVFRSSREIIQRKLRPVCESGKLTDPKGNKQENNVYFFHFIFLNKLHLWGRS